VEAGKGFLGFRDVQKCRDELKHSNVVDHKNVNGHRSLNGSKGVLIDNGAVITEIARAMCLLDRATGGSWSQILV